MGNELSFKRDRIIIKFVIREGEEKSISYGEEMKSNKFSFSFFNFWKED